MNADVHPLLALILAVPLAVWSHLLVFGAGMLAMLWYRRHQGMALAAALEDAALFRDLYSASAQLRARERCDEAAQKEWERVHGLDDLGSLDDPPSPSMPHHSVPQTAPAAHLSLSASRKAGEAAREPSGSQGFFRPPPLKAHVDARAIERERERAKDASLAARRGISPG